MSIVRFFQDPIAAFDIFWTNLVGVADSVDIWDPDSYLQGWGDPWRNLSDSRSRGHK